jgi:hypothetical protein
LIHERERERETLTSNNTASLERETNEECQGITIASGTSRSSPIEPHFEILTPRSGIDGLTPTYATTSLNLMNMKMNDGTHASTLLAATSDNIDSHTIRLVTLLKDHDASPIRCELRRSTLADARESYSAVSYCWGGQAQPCEISLGGASFKVTRNLFEILLELRTSSLEDQVLWIDALCINQLDVSERNSQVKQMHMVYAYASTTLICLGPASKAGVSMMQFLHDCPVDQDTAAELLDSLERRDNNFVLAFYQGLVEFYLCEYWTRVWVVQEIYHSRRHDIKVIWGGQAIDYFCLYEIREALVRTRDEQVDVFGGSANFADHAIQRALHSAGKIEQYTQLLPLLHYKGPATTTSKGHKSLYWEIEMYRDKKCSDLRDYVYGYYRLLPDEAQALTSINYRAPAPEVYFDATLAYIQATKRYDILVWPKAAARSTFMDGYPSWVRDWSQTTIGLGPSFYTRTRSERELIVPCIEVKNRTRALSTQGIKLGTVTISCTMGPPRAFGSSDSRPTDLAIFHQNMLQAYESLQALPSYLGATSNTIRQSLIRAGMTKAMGLGLEEDDMMELFIAAPGDSIDEASLRWLDFALDTSTGRDLVAISTCPPHGSTDQMDVGMINPSSQIGDSIFVLDGCALLSSFERLTKDQRTL